MKSLNQFVHQLAGKDASLDRLRAGARKLEVLTRSIRARLPADARRHVVGCAPRNGAIVVLADSAAWAAQLRYLQHEILAICRQELGEHVHHVQFRILPPESLSGGVEKPPAPELSENTRRLLQGAATGIADDELAAALRRLSEKDQDAD